MKTLNDAAGRTWTISLNLGTATEQVKAQLKEGIQIVHAELEAAGNLPDKPVAEAAA
jgi:hypothetical protein